ncbi:glycosyltransferase [Salinimicrobium xinjiangense]|uniref:glycosyltransferase n=1 Tax=Salinimicrobium xinjiangense TaxID=438596 RepID=UPI000426F392|nr:glycosyltransferase [Salinimicrobium xinjiangense]
MRSSQPLLFFLFHYNKGGGAEWVITNLANQMVQMGIKVTILSVKEGTMFEELNSGVKIKKYNGNYWKAFIGLIKELRNQHYSVLFTTQRVAAIFAYFANLLSFKKTNHIVREAGSNFNFAFENHNWFQKKLYRFLYRISYNKAYKVIVNSEATKKDLIRSGIIPKEKQNVFQINNPLDLDRIREKANLKEFPITNFKEKTIVSIGRLIPYKKMDLVIRAFHHVIKEDQTTQLIIVGSGSEEEHLKNLVGELKITPHVTFTGYIPNPYPILRDADLFILASRREGFGMVVAEALTLGIPVIVGDYKDSGPVNIIQNGKYGSLFEPDNIEDLVACIKRNLSKNHNISKLIERSSDFDMRKITNEYISVIFS